MSSSVVFCEIRQQLFKFANSLAPPSYQPCRFTIPEILTRLCSRIVGRLHYFEHTITINLQSYPHPTETDVFSPECKSVTKNGIATISGIT